jgi:D-amino peptidase
LPPAQPADARSGVFISVDMEGIAGVVHLHQVMRGTPEFERSCRWMTAETNAAVAGARRAGANRFLVNDSHGDMRNLILDELDSDVEIISDAAIGTGRAIMDHSYGGRTIYGIRLNGKPQSEATLNAALAGTYGVRTALITGDHAAVEEAEAELPGIEGVIVKQALGRMAAKSLHPAAACRRIEAGAFEAMSRLDERPLYRLNGPFELEIEWQNTAMADACEQVPGIERTGGRTVCYRDADYRRSYQALLSLLTMALPSAYQYPRP